MRLSSEFFAKIVSYKSIDWVSVLLPVLSPHMYHCLIQKSFQIVGCFIIDVFLPSPSHMVISDSFYKELSNSDCQ
jgi:hypothetical protein